MNKWQIICPVVALLIAGFIFAIITSRNHRNYFISVMSRSIGGDLIESTNSAHLVSIGPRLQTRLSELLSSPAGVATVRLGDEPSPHGDGTACSRLVLTNEAGMALLIRLRPAEESSMFHVLGYRTFLQ